MSVVEEVGGELEMSSRGNNVSPNGSIVKCVSHREGSD